MSNFSTKTNIVQAIEMHSINPPDKISALSLDLSDDNLDQSDGACGRGLADNNKINFLASKTAIKPTPSNKLHQALPQTYQDPRLAWAAWSHIAEGSDSDARALVQSLGPVAALEWLFESADNSDSDSANWSRQLGRWLPRLKTLSIEQDLELLYGLGGKLVVPGDPYWPAALEDLDQCRPFALWARGDISVLKACSQQAIAIVGARAANSIGERTAANLALAASEAGYVVISGGAYGIDRAASQGALCGSTPAIVVLAGGVDQYYPAANAALIGQVSRDGIVISERPVNARPTRWRFLDRNRLIAALGQATVVVQAALRSGALNTARQALELGRQVGAVPGSVDLPQSSGCHQLIRDGATLVANQNHLLELLHPIGHDLSDQDSEQKHLSLLDGLDPICARVFDALPLHKGTDLDRLVCAAGMDAPEVLSALGKLALAGKVSRIGGHWKRTN